MNSTLTRPHFRIGLTLLLGWLGGTSDGSAQVVVNQGQLATTLGRGQSEERAAAIFAIRDIPMAARGPLIQSALLQELTRQREEHDVRARALQAGNPLPPRKDHGEYLFAVLDLVAEDNDPVVIEALVPFIGTGNRVMNAIVAFGDLAVPDVAEFAASVESPQNEVSPALRVLKRMLDRPPRYPLSEQSIRLITELARERLSGTQEASVVVSAVDLAVATGASALIQRVEQLARDVGEVRALGIRDPGLIDLVQPGHVRRSGLGMRPRTAGFSKTDIPKRTCGAASKAPSPEQRPPWAK